MIWEKMARDKLANLSFINNRRLEQVQVQVQGGHGKGKGSRQA
jgi:hypothetical protein